MPCLSPPSPFPIFIVNDKNNTPISTLSCPPIALRCQAVLEQRAKLFAWSKHFAFLTVRDLTLCLFQRDAEFLSQVPRCPCPPCSCPFLLWCPPLFASSPTSKKPIKISQTVKLRRIFLQNPTIHPIKLKIRDF